MADLRQVVNVQLPAEEENGKPPVHLIPLSKDNKSEMTSCLDLPLGRAPIIIIITEKLILIE